MTTTSNLTFPFGQPIRLVEQVDRASKRVFVLGVYSSAVHARWCDPHGNKLIKALAVASEPYIFWRGEDASDFISRIEIPKDAGVLEAAEKRYNGPSGRSLDKHYLGPLGLTRNDVWLCDCIPHSCMNQKQSVALRRDYYPVSDNLGLPSTNWPSPPSQIARDRVKEIASELNESQAEIVITLGDSPLKWFATPELGSKRRLQSYGKNRDGYGKFHKVQFKERTLRLLPLAHPRQVSKISKHDADWANLHKTWEQQVAPQLM